MLKRTKIFSRNEDGAVTVDWVVLTAAIVGLAGVVYAAINGPTGSVATVVSDALADSNVSTGL